MRTALAPLAPAALMVSLPAAAHEANEQTAATAAAGQWAQWSFDPWLVVPLAVIGIGYLVGLVRIWRRAGITRGARGWHVVAFVSGWLALAIALISPLHAASERSFFAHMTEHELLMVIAAPLLAASRPLAVLLWSLPPRARIAVGRFGQRNWLRRIWRAATDPPIATLVHGVVLWTWHVPVLFEVALHDLGIHALQHASFLLSALLFWWALLHGRWRRRDHGFAVLALFATAAHCSLLGALLVFSPGLWYPAYAGGQSGLSPLEDQQLAGLVMWVPAGIVYTIAGLALFAFWLNGRQPRPVDDGHGLAVGR